MVDSSEVQAYKRKEINQALFNHPEHHALTVKVVGDTGASKYLNATPAQVRVLREVLGGGSLTDITDAVWAMFREDT